MKFIDTRHFENIPTDRFLREAETLTKLDHPGIAKVITAGTHSLDDQEVPWVCMELIDDARAFDERLPSGQGGVPCCIQLTEALTHAHEPRCVCTWISNLPTSSSMGNTSPT